MKSTILAGALVVATAAFAVAQGFEGVYDGSRSGAVTEYGCNLDYQGMDGGPLVITKTAFHGVESSCELSNPTGLRGIDGVLYDAACFAEGDEYNYRLMFVRADGAVYMYREGYMSKLQLCE